MAPPLAECRSVARAWPPEHAGSILAPVRHRSSRLTAPRWLGACYQGRPRPQKPVEPRAHGGAGGPWSHAGVLTCEVRALWRADLHSTRPRVGHVESHPCADTGGPPRASFT